MHKYEAITSKHTGPGHMSRQIGAEPFKQTEKPFRQKVVQIKLCTKWVDLPASDNMSKVLLYWKAQCMYFKGTATGNCKKGF